jgi:hypothetical protein
MAVELERAATRMENPVLRELHELDLAEAGIPTRRVNRDQVDTGLRINQHSFTPGAKPSGVNFTPIETRETNPPSLASGRSI